MITGRENNPERLYIKQGNQCINLSLHIFVIRPSAFINRLQSEESLGPIYSDPNDRLENGKDCHEEAPEAHQ